MFNFKKGTTNSYQDGQSTSGEVEITSTSTPGSSQRKTLSNQHGFVNLTGSDMTRKMGLHCLTCEKYNSSPKSAFIKETQNFQRSALLRHQESDEHTIACQSRKEKLFIACTAEVMGTYLLMLYVTLEKEEALKEFFTENEWSFKKPDLTVLTEHVGPPCIPEISPPVVKNLKDVTLNKNSRPDVEKPGKTVLEPANEEFSQENEIDGNQDDFHAVNDDYLDDRKGSVNQQEETELNEVNDVKEACSPNLELNKGPHATLMPRKSSRLSQKRKPSWSFLTTKKKKLEKKDKVKEIKTESDALKCGQLFPSVEKCKEHQSLKHNSTIVNDIFKAEVKDYPAWTCKDCKEDFRDQRSLDRHSFEIHTKKDDQIKIQQSLKTVSNKDELCICSTCHKQFEDMLSLEAHCKEEHCSPLKKKGARYSCSVCEKGFISLKAFKSHISLHEVNADHQKPVKSFSCNFCNTVFDSHQILKEHVKEVHNESQVKDQLYICEICGKVFRRGDYLKEHRNAIHLGIQKKENSAGNKPNNICEICGAKFKRRSHLEEHISLKHNNTPVTVHTCSTCSKTFHRPSKLEYHVNKEHLHSKPYSCEKCPAKFYSKVAMKYHIRACIMSEDLMKTCEHCGKKFKTNHNYKLHIQAVHSDPALVCACGTVVRWQSSVTKHKRRCPLNSVNLGEKIRPRHSQKTAKSSVHLRIENAGQIETVVPQLQYINLETDTMDEGGTVKGIHKTVTQGNAGTEMVSFATTNTLENTETPENFGRPVGGDRLDEHVLNDLVNGVEEQVVEISSTPQLTIRLEESDDTQHVYYVILKK